MGIVDVHLGRLDLGQVKPKRIHLTVGFIDSTLGATIYVTSKGMDTFVSLKVVADMAAIDVDNSIAMSNRSFILKYYTVVRIRNHLTRIFRVFNLSGQEIDANRGHTATAIDGAEHGAAFDIDIGVADHSTCGKDITREATATTIHIAFQGSCAPCANERT